MSDIWLPQVIMAGSPAAAGGGYVGQQPDLAVVCREGTGTTVAMEIGGGNLTASTAAWIAGPPVAYNSNDANGLLSTDNQFSAVLGSLADTLTLFARLDHDSSWNFVTKHWCGYGNGTGSGMCFRTYVNQNHTNGNYRINFNYRIGGSTGSVNAMVDLGATERTAEHSIGVVYDGTDVQFYFDGATHGSAQSLTGSFTLPTADRVLCVGANNSGGSPSEEWDYGIRDWRLSLSALNATQMQEWHDNPVT